LIDAGLEGIFGVKFVGGGGLNFSDGVGMIWHGICVWGSNFWKAGFGCASFFGTINFN
jgi:hypothetical protein